MSTSSPKSPLKRSNTNPTTPLSPFPSTPHRLSYLANTNLDDNSPLSEHISPTKALAQSRLNHEIATLTSWLEGLFAPDAVPSHLLKWRDEALAAGNTSHAGFDGGLIGGYDGGLALHTPIRGGQASGQIGTSSESGSGNDVLEVLNALKQINLSTDHLASLVHAARCEELRGVEEAQARIQKQRDDGIRARLILDEVYTRLSPEAVDALGSMSEAAVTLGLDPGSDLGERGSTGDNVGAGNLMKLFSQGILKRAHRKLIVDDQIRELCMLQDRITNVAGGSLADQADDQVTGEDESGHRDEQLNARTAQFNRDTKQINLKIMEYHDRVTSLERQLASLRAQSTTSLGDVLIAREKVQERRARVKALQERFAAFNGLPPDLEDSRNEVRRAVQELEGLKKRREGLFERMGTG